ncbi:DUF6313 family protein [Streptomyces sp. NPDC023588]|uniref:DUF6313 family protein n=1 Tax=Streptomyces sp. NPDC023588 TaxID=3154907 RepID=UPI0033E40498
MGFILLYLLAGWRMGYSAAYQVMIGIAPPDRTDCRAIAWVLSVTGWLLVPATVGGTAGYLVSHDIERWRSEPGATVIHRMKREAGG